MQGELRESGDGGFAFGVDPQGFVAAALGGADVLFPLVEGEAAVDEGEDVGWVSGGDGC